MLGKQRKWRARRGDVNLSLTPVAVSGISSAVAIAAGGWHTCAVLADGTVRCWGWNAYGQLGDSTTNDSSTPVAVAGISSAISIAAGDFHTCALLKDGTIRCWGMGTSGQLGNGSWADSSKPVVVGGISGAIRLGAGGSHTCTILGRRFCTLLGGGRHTRQREHWFEFDTSCGQRYLDRDHDRRRLGPHLRSPGRRRRSLLGVERPWPARQRDHDRRLGPHRGGRPVGAVGSVPATLTPAPC